MAFNVKGSKKDKVERVNFDLQNRAKDLMGNITTITHYICQTRTVRWLL